MVSLIPGHFKYKTEFIFLALEHWVSVTEFCYFNTNETFRILLVRTDLKLAFT